MAKSRVFDAGSPCPFSSRGVVFDTNIWMKIEGYGSRPGDPMQGIYSDLLRRLRNDQNVIVVNNYIIGEFFNRSCKLEYAIFCEERRERGKPEMYFKVARKEPVLLERLETVRDTCLNIIEDCLYEHLDDDGCSIGDILAESAAGGLDFTDIFLRQNCLAKGYALVTHDRDFANCGIDLVTANKALLS